MFAMDCFKSVFYITLFYIQNMLELLEEMPNGVPSHKVRLVQSQLIVSNNVLYVVEIFIHLFSCSLACFSVHLSFVHSFVHLCIHSLTHFNFGLTVLNEKLSFQCV